MEGQPDEIVVLLWQDGIEVEVADTFDCHEVRSRKTVAVEDESGAIRRALDQPIASKPLVELARGKKTAAISVCDITRPAPNRITLPPLLARLHSAGIARENILILIATGLHRAATKEEIDRIVGPEIAAGYRVANHDARAFREHRHVGDTRRGTPVYVDERFVSADLHITLGFIEQHLMLGFSGGRKLIVPGLAAQETIKVIHSPRFIREPLATEGSINGNPLHEELLECARMVRHDFIVDVALTQERKIAGVFAGDPVRAHAAGVDFVERACLEEIERTGRCRDHQRGRVSARLDVLPICQRRHRSHPHCETGRQDSGDCRMCRGHGFGGVRAHDPKHGGICRVSR